MLAELCTGCGEGWVSRALFTAVQQARMWTLAIPEPEPAGLQQAFAGFCREACSGLLAQHRSASSWP